MKIRTALGALCGALALTAGLVVSAGTAGASVPADRCGNHCNGNGNGGIATTDPGSTRDGRTITCTGAVGVCTTTFANGHTTTCTITTGTTCTDTLPGHPGFHPGFPGGFGNNGLGLGLGLGVGGLDLGGLSLVNGQILVLGDGTQVNVCTVPDWNGFYGRFNPHFGGLRDRINELRYRNLVQSAGCANDLNGLNLNGNLLNLGAYGVLGGSAVNVCDYGSWDNFNQFGVRRFGSHFGGFGNRFGHVLGGGGWNQLRLRAHCQPQIVVIPGGTTTVEQAPPVPVAPPVPADTPTPEAVPAPAPLTGSGNYRYPSSAPNTGDGSLAGK